jgi:hypothetical protein
VAAARGRPRPPARLPYRAAAPPLRLLWAVAAGHRCPAAAAAQTLLYPSQPHGPARPRPLSPLPSCTHPALPACQPRPPLPSKRPYRPPPRLSSSPPAAPFPLSQPSAAERPPPPPPPSPSPPLSTAAARQRRGRVRAANNHPPNASRAADPRRHRHTLPLPAPARPAPPCCARAPGPGQLPPLPRAAPPSPPLPIRAKVPLNAPPGSHHRPRPRPSAVGVVTQGSWQLTRASVRPVKSWKQAWRAVPAKGRARARGSDADGGARRRCFGPRALGRPPIFAVRR